MHFISYNTYYKSKCYSHIFQTFTTLNIDVRIKNDSIHIERYSSPGDSIIRWISRSRGYAFAYMYTRTSNHIYVVGADFSSLSKSDDTVSIGVYIVDDINDVPTPYYIPGKVVRYYILMPSLEQFLTDIKACLLVVDHEFYWKKNAMINIDGSVAQEFIKQLNQLTNIYNFYADARE
ncbi:MAG: hypothetical protein QXF17_04270 [Ignisphaera sp.]